MTEVTWRRAYQFGDLVRVLKLSAVNFDDSIAIFEEDFCCGLYDPGLSGAGWSQKEHSPDWASGVLHTCEEYLIESRDAANGAFLSHDQGAEMIFELFSSRTLLLRIERYSILCVPLRFCHLINSRPKRESEPRYCY